MIGDSELTCGEVTGYSLLLLRPAGNYDKIEAATHRNAVCLSSCNTAALHQDASRSAALSGCAGGAPSTGVCRHAGTASRPVASCPEGAGRRSVYRSGHGRPPGSPPLSPLSRSLPSPGERPAPAPAGRRAGRLIPMHRPRSRPVTGARPDGRGEGRVAAGAGDPEPGGSGEPDHVRISYTSHS